MADEVDRAADVTDAYLSAAIDRARQPVPRGFPGDCFECGNASLRLVAGRCAPCRDEAARDVILGR